jgi:hypothetical protein
MVLCQIEDGNSRLARERIDVQQRVEIAREKHKQVLHFLEPNHFKAQLL